jgi:hypothetical protein
MCKTEELSTGHTKTFSFTPETLPPNYVWELIPINTSVENTQKMFPARQHTTQSQDFDVPFLNLKGRSFATQYIQQQPHPLPHIELHSPHISSEAGYFSIPYTLHIQPSSVQENSYAKFVVPYPQARLIASETFLTSFAIYPHPTSNTSHLLFTSRGLGLQGIPQ